MSLITELGLLTGSMSKVAFDQSGMGGFDPFSRRYNSAPPAAYNPGFNPHAGGYDLGGGQQFQQAPQQQAAPAAPQAAQPESNPVNQGGAWNTINGALGVTPMGMAWNAGMEGLGYLTGNAANKQQINQAFNDHKIDLNKDSVVGAAGKAVSGAGMAIASPIATTRWLGSQFHEGLKNDPIYKGVGNAASAVGGAVRGGYDALVNRPANQLFGGGAAPAKQPIVKKVARIPGQQGAAAPGGAAGSNPYAQ